MSTSEHVLVPRSLRDHITRFSFCHITPTFVLVLSALVSSSDLIMGSSWETPVKELIRFAILGHNQDVGSSTKKRKWESTKDVSVENPNLGKTTTALRLQDITMRGLQWWGTKATTSWSLASPQGGYNRGNNLLLSLTLSLYTITHYTSTLQLRNIEQHHIFLVFPKSYLY